MLSEKAILITGASSGLGAALARHYAAEGNVLYLGGRDRERLEKVAAECRLKGARVETACVDVTDASGMQAWIDAADQETPLSLVIANAGISAGSGIHGETASQARHIFSVNLGGVLNTVLPVIPRMTARGEGQIAIISSLAGLRGLPSAPAYSASKAAVKAYAEALRGLLQWQGVKVNVVCPGYIRTPLTEKNPFPMPFLMDADKAAHMIARGLARNKGRIAFPWGLYWPALWLSMLPVGIGDFIYARLPAKPEAPL